MTHITKEIWHDRIRGWNIVDCAVRSKDIISLCLRRDIPKEAVSWTADADIESRLMNIFINQTENIFGDRTYTGLNLPRIGVCSRPVSQALMVARNTDGQVALLGGGRDFADEFIEPGKVPMTWRIKTIGGYAYSVGGQRKIYKRTDVGQWERVLALPPVEAIETVGFNDMDAFDEQDMYAVGGHGDVWHYDGKRWRQLRFPADQQLGTVTCAGDGQVYISGEGGSLWVGRQSTWKCLHQGSASVLWNDAVWFHGKLWLASDYQFKIWDGQSLGPVMDGDKQLWLNGHLDGRDGVLVIAGREQVTVYDGQTWRTIVAPYVD
jgi:hypothetical protein